jgi:hypothetical protein
MKCFLAGALTLAVLSGSSGYACTPDELQDKITAVSAKIQDLSQRDPQKVNDWSQKIAAQQQGTAQPKTIDELCKLYDEMLAGLN